jgi:hypothetical protein
VRATDSAGVRLAVHNGLDWARGLGESVVRLDRRLAGVVRACSVIGAEVHEGKADGPGTHATAQSPLRIHLEARASERRGDSRAGDAFDANAPYVEVRLK